MAGARIELDHKEASVALARAGVVLADLKPLWRDFGEYLQIAHRQRFRDQVSPEGNQWQALSPRYLARKRKNKDKILRLDGYLANTLRYEVGAQELLFGSDRKYAAIHQFGGEIKKAERTATLFFRRRRDGSVGSRFVKKSRSDFAQDVAVGAHTTTMPARPFLGVSAADGDELVQITLRHLERALAR